MNYWLVGALGMLLSACSTAPRTVVSGRIEGTLVEPRCRYVAQSVDLDYESCARIGAGRPMAIETDDGLIWLTETSAELAEHVTQRVRIDARLSSDGTVAMPRAAEVRRNERWIPVDDEFPSS